jgi:hypothetical protein
VALIADHKPRTARLAGRPLASAEPVRIVSDGGEALRPMRRLGIVSFDCSILSGRARCGENGR